MRIGAKACFWAWGNPPWRVPERVSHELWRVWLKVERKMDQQEEAEEAESESVTNMPKFTQKVRGNRFRFPIQPIEPLLSPFPPVQSYFGF